MARITTLGFENNSNTNGIEFNSTNDNPSIQSSVKRSGNYAGRITGLTSGTSRGWRTTCKSSGTTAAIYVRFYLRIDTAPSALTTIFGAYQIADWPISTQAANIRMTTGGALRLYNATTQVGSDSAALNTGTWYRIELYWDATGGAGASSLNARIDGVSFASSSSLTLAITSQQYIAFGGNLNTSANTATTCDYYFDDIAVNDTSGGSQTSWPGAGNVVHLKPNAAGDNAMGSRGGADSGTDYGQVDEETPNDATDYYILDVANDILDVGVESSATAGIGTSDTITLVQVASRQAGADTSSTHAYSLRLKSASGGTTTETANPDDISSSSYYTYHTSDNRQIPFLVSYTDPTTTAAWTATGTNSLDNMQIGIKATDATPDVYVSALWAIVEYVSSAAVDLNVSVSDSVTITESKSVYIEAVEIKVRVMPDIQMIGGVRIV